MKAQVRGKVLQSSIQDLLQEDGASIDGRPSIRNILEVVFEMCVIAFGQKRWKKTENQFLAKQ